MQLITQKFKINLEMLKSVSKITTFTPFSYSTKLIKGDKIIFAFRIDLLQFFIIGEDIFFPFEVNHLLLQSHK